MIYQKLLNVLFACLLFLEGIVQFMKQRIQSQLIVNNSNNPTKKKKIKTVGKPIHAKETEATEETEEKQKHTKNQQEQVFKPIGVVHSVFGEKFATPRQGLFIDSTRGIIVLDPTIVDAQSSTIGLEEFSHIWVLFAFNLNRHKEKHSSKSTLGGKIAPPMFGGEKTGVFATRSPHRPNSLGLSLVKLDKVAMEEGKIFISALDLCHGTLVYDVKPYVEKVDRPPHNEASRFPKWIDNKDFDPVPVDFTAEAEASLRRLVETGELKFYTKDEYELVKSTLVRIIALDPRDVNRGRGNFEEEAILTRVVYMNFDSLNIHFKPIRTRRFVVEIVEPYNKLLLL